MRVAVVQHPLLDFRSDDRNFDHVARLARTEDNAMPIPKQPVWHCENQYSADSACAHCEGVIRHEPWCITQNADVRYAFHSGLVSPPVDTSRPFDPARIGCRVERQKELRGEALKFPIAAIAKLELPA